MSLFIKQVGRQLELNGSLGCALGQTLAGADIERDACPAPVINLQFERGIRLRPGVWVNSFFFPIALYVLAANFARTILAANDVLIGDRLNRFPDLQLRSLGRSITPLSDVEANLNYAFAI